ncbi:MAG TPA: 1-acyl-sn-glycerol-3-phosphate acyltransferase [Longimicrobiales bacterium]|nr:1-acyl-sn-glycerol-3-phosphate acyltransferase [Longimicrobiales bacterium]
MLARWITAGAGWAAHEFYVLDQRGPAIPPGPVLVVANHPNALLDPLIIFRVAGRVVRPLAKEPLFKHPLIGPVLKALGGLPVYRKQDHPEQMHQNERTFEAAVAALHAGDAVQIYPEGQSHSEAHLTPFKTGAARIAFKAEGDANWQLKLNIVPVGLTYARKTFFRGRAVAVVGEAFEITPWRAAYESDPVQGVKLLTDEFTKRLEAITLNLTRTEDTVLIDTAERLYAREKGLAGWREQDSLAERLPRLQAFARGLGWLREHEPARHARLAREVRHYRMLSRTLGAGDGDVPPAYSAGTVLRYVLREGLMLGLGLPLAAVALIFWYPPYALNRLIVNRLQVEESGVATYKLGLSLVLFPVTLAIWCAVAFGQWGMRGLLVALVVLPLLGWVLHRWAGRWDRVAQDVRLFVNVTARPRAQHELAAQRTRLVADFDDVAKKI